VPRSRANRKIGPRGRRVLPVPSMGRGTAMTEQIGPSMSTEPGWMAVRRTSRSLLGVATGAGRNDASMLLSFERPASAGAHGDTSIDDVPQCVRTGRRSRLSAVLENCTEATSAAIDKRRLKNGYHRALQDRLCPACAPQGAQNGCGGHVGPDHRQDSKGTRWMPWHQESMKGVNGCDKPRLGAK
jgi:hypothetical protein